MFRGKFNDSRAELEAAVAALDRHGVPQIVQTWYTPAIASPGLYAELGYVRFVQGDLAAAEPTFAKIATRCQELTFPGNEVSFCYGRAREATVRIEAGQLERAAKSSTTSPRVRQYDLAEWAMVAASFRASMAARTILACGETDPAVLQPHIDNMTAVVEAWRAAELKSYLASYESVLARLHTAAAIGRRPGNARRWRWRWPTKRASSPTRPNYCAYWHSPTMIPTRGTPA